MRAFWPCTRTLHKVAYFPDEQAESGQEDAQPTSIRPLDVPLDVDVAPPTSTPAVPAQALERTTQTPPAAQPAAPTRLMIPLPPPQPVEPEALRANPAAQPPSADGTPQAAPPRVQPAAPAAASSAAPVASSPQAERGTGEARRIHTSTLSKPSLEGEDEEFLRSLLPTEPTAERRVVAALLRALHTEGRQS